MGNWGNWTHMERRKNVFPNHVSDQEKNDWHESKPDAGEPYSWVQMLVH